MQNLPSSSPKPKKLETNAQLNNLLTSLDLVALGLYHQKAPLAIKAEEAAFHAAFSKHDEKEASLLEVVAKCRGHIVQGEYGQAKECLTRLNTVATFQNNEKFKEVIQALRRHLSGPAAKALDRPSESSVGDAVKEASQRVRGAIG